MKFTTQLQLVQKYRVNEALPSWRRHEKLYKYLYIYICILDDGLWTDSCNATV